MPGRRFGTRAPDWVGISKKKEGGGMLAFWAHCNRFATWFFCCSRGCIGFTGVTKWIGTERASDQVDFSSGEYICAASMVCFYSSFRLRVFFILFVVPQ